MTTQKAFDYIIQEYFEAKKKHPTFPHRFGRQLSILIEEVGEVAKEINEWSNQPWDSDDKELEQKLITELAQTGAVIVRMLEDMNKCC